MESNFRVHVVDRNRGNLMMRYTCPETGKQIARSTGTTKVSEARKVAAKWEAELQEGRYTRSDKMPWEEFRLRWQQANGVAVSPATYRNYLLTFTAFQRLCRPQRLADLSTARVTAFAAELRKPKTRKRCVRRQGRKVETVETYTISEATVGKHLRFLKAIARWGHRQGLLAKVPTFDMPRRGVAAKMKGRPITGEEFERMIDAVEKVTGAVAADSWKLLLWGLWWSGLRLGEALALRWEPTPGAVWLVLEGRRSVLAFDAESQKSGKVELVPLAPEAVQLLEPIRQRRGYVFAPLRIRGEGTMARDVLKVGKIIGKIGAAAGVVVNVETGKSASAHDLRRAFGARWSKRIMPAELKALMRHASIDTTMTYYVGQNATESAEGLWRAAGDLLGDLGPSASQKQGR